MIRDAFLFHIQNLCLQKSNYTFEGQPSGQYLPEDNAPAEYIALFRIDVTLDLLGGHPGSTALHVGHDRRLVTGGTKVADLHIK